MIRSLFVAESIRLGARAIASGAAQSLLEANPDTARRFGGGFSHWQEFLTHRLIELASAIEFESSELFAHDAAWALASFESRGVPREDLAKGLESLIASIQESTKPDDAQTAIEALRVGIEAIQGPARQMARLASGTTSSDLAIRYLQAAISGDRRNAISMICDAFNSGTSALDLYDQVLIPAQREIGTMWHLGEISVPEEHAATDATRSSMAVLAHTATRQPTRDWTILVASIEGDNHDVGVRALADLLEIGGFRAICLGANVPGEDLANACADFDANLLALSATMSIHLPAMAQAIDLLDARLGDNRPRVLVGGPIFSIVPGLGDRLGANAEARSLGEAIAQAEALAH